MATTSTVQFRPIKPGKFNNRSATGIMVQTMRKIADGMEKDFKKTTATWSREVVFEKQYNVRRQDAFIASVTTTNQIYGWVNNGTKARMIRVKNARYLKFGSEWSPSTFPRTIDSFNGGQSGHPIYTKQTYNPGIAAREFDVVIADKWRPEFYKACEDALRRAAIASGFAY